MIADALSALVLRAQSFAAAVILAAQKCAADVVGGVRAAIANLASSRHLGRASVGISLNLLLHNYLSGRSGRGRCLRRHLLHLLWLSHHLGLAHHLGLTHHLGLHTLLDTPS